MLAHLPEWARIALISLAIVLAVLLLLGAICAWAANTLARAFTTGGRG